jgi:hypothetical protein
MTQLSGPTAFYQVAAAVLAAVRTALASGPTPVPTRVGVVPGAIAWDNCEQCGVLAVSLARVFLSDDFPAEAGFTPQGNCSSAWLVGNFTLQLVRCAPVPDATGSGPTVTALDASAQVVMADASLVLATVACSLADLVAADQIVDYVVRQQLMVGPEGACVGSQVDFLVAVVR